jgi:peptidoglycan hydrolase CwlO-like protein
MEVADLASVFNAFASSVTSLAAEVVSVGEQHSMALAVISEKDQAIEQVTAYARHCEAAVAGKDAEIAEALSYAGKCEEAIRSKDSEIAEAKALLDELEALRAQFLLRLLRKLRLLK